MMWHFSQLRIPEWIHLGMTSLQYFTDLDDLGIHSPPNVLPMPSPIPLLSHQTGANMSKVRGALGSCEYVHASKRHRMECSRHGFGKPLLTAFSQVYTTLTSMSQVRQVTTYESTQSNATTRNDDSFTETKDTWSPSAQKPLEWWKHLTSHCHESKEICEWTHMEMVQPVQPP